MILSNLESHVSSFSRFFAVEILKSLDHKNIINAYVNSAGILMRLGSGLL
jgi:hypothetical protein